jgi:NADP-dependent 3-hydroxy acid dehydrogenase YdfG
VNKKLETLFQENVKNKVILITGASSGIGLTVAKKMASAGAHVLLVARTQDTLQQVQTEIVQAGGKSINLSMRFE